MLNLRHNNFYQTNSSFPPPQGTDVVLVQPQPQVLTTTVHKPNKPNFAITETLTFAVVITIFLVSCGCWYAIICSGIGIALAASVSDVSTLQQGS